MISMLLLTTYIAKTRADTSETKTILRTEYRYLVYRQNNAEEIRIHT